MQNAADFSTAESRTFFDYWQSRPKEGRVVPDRTHFDPLAIRQLMPMTVMVEYESVQEATFRYAGSAITDIVGFDPTKKKYLDLLEDEAMAGFLAASEPMISVPCGGSFLVKVRAATGYTMKCEALELPLFNEKAGTWIVLALISIREIVGMHSGSDFKILEIGRGNWIDVGAGVPAS